MEYIQMLFKKRRESNNPSHYRKSLTFNIISIMRIHAYTQIGSAIF